MPRIPTLRPLRTTRMKDDDPPRRLGRAGLGSLMRDPRYWDREDPEHDSVVDMMRRGFELVFAPRRAGPGPGPGADDGVTDPDGPFGQSFAKRVRDARALDCLPTRDREALGRTVLLDALKAAGHRLPSGLVPPPGMRLPPWIATARGEDTRQSDAPPAQPHKGADEPPLQESGKDKVFPRQPIGKDGKEIKPHPEDPRYNPDGSLKDDFLPGDPARTWYAQNSRYNPETGDFEWYQDLPGFERDFNDRGRWRIKSPPQRVEGPRLPDHRGKDEEIKPGNTPSDLPDLDPPPPSGPPPAPAGLPRKKRYVPRLRFR